MPSSARLRAILRISFTITGARPSDASSTTSTVGLAIRPAAHGEHLLLAAGERAGQLVAALGEAGQVPRRRARAAPRTQARSPRCVHEPTWRLRSTVRSPKTRRPSGTITMPACTHRLPWTSR